ncbi:MAG: hypothetical protein II137_05690 [Anaerovibrio sp.]|nr:hypothetical protein [Anaerovibrio sp.]
MVIVWGLSFWLIVNVVLVAGLVVVIRRINRLEEMARINLKTQKKIEASLIKVLKSGGDEEANESKK